MAEQQVPAPLPPTKLVLPEKCADLTPLQKGWLQMSMKRQQTFEQLQKNELKIQADVNATLELADLPSVQEYLKGIKALFAESVECRKHFTGIIKEKLIDTAMEFEKRMEPLVEQATKHEFTLRKAASIKAAAEQEKNAELSKFKAHVKNEQVRIAAKYKLDLLANINSAYNGCLTAKTDADKVPYDLFEAALKEIKLSKFDKFGEFHWITTEEARAAFDAEPKYTGEEDLADALRGLRVKFAMYEQDLQNVQLALEKSIKEQQQQGEAILEEAEVESATNTLVAEGTTVQVTNAPKVRRKMQIVYEEGDEWMLNVIRAFMNNFTSARPHVKNKTLDKLTIGQMAAALAAIHNADGKTIFTGLNFEPIEK